MRGPEPPDVSESSDLLVLSQTIKNRGLNHLTTFSTSDIFVLTKFDEKRVIWIIKVVFRFVLVDSVPFF